ncbi:hypothetical protein J41TS12_30830 [Paenibacillus antibioticophila]|uniref:Uncharacterized protein n=1 Tax=Paenibacillus antibioticophila TaxID=1274374 RepID=A0A919XS43_9BACL|nr:hypothetical protein J41TS12_30830 [Paenibacillus antibioticophila]
MYEFPYKISELAVSTVTFIRIFVQNRCAGDRQKTGMWAFVRIIVQTIELAPLEAVLVRIFVHKSNISQGCITNNESRIKNH